MRCSFSPYDGSGKYIFVSYSHSDEEKVAPILERLNSEGFRIWYDDGIDLGTEWPESIGMHVYNCEVCLAFHSKRSVNSPNCRQEIRYALKEKKSILSVYLEEVELSHGMDMQLSSFQAVYFYQYKDADIDKFFTRIIESGVLQQCKAKSDYVAVSRKSFNSAFKNDFLNVKFKVTDTYKKGPIKLTGETGFWIISFLDPDWEDYDQILEGVRINFKKARSSARKTTIECNIMCENANPNIFHSEIDITSDKEFCLELDGSSALMYSPLDNWSGGKKKLSSAIISDAGAPVGFDVPDGIMRGYGRFKGGPTVSIWINVKYIQADETKNDNGNNSLREKDTLPKGFNNRNSYEKDFLMAKSRTSGAYKKGPFKLSGETEFWVLAVLYPNWGNYNQTIDDVRINFKKRKCSTNKEYIECSIMCENAEPSVCRSEIMVYSDKEFQLEIVDSSAYMYSPLDNWKGDGKGKRLSDDAFGDEGALVGFDVPDGIMRGYGQYKHGPTVSIKLIVKYLQPDDAGSEITVKSTDSAINNNEKFVWDSTFRGLFDYHSGFVIETPSVTMLFDCTKMELLPEFGQDKPIVVFISHLHQDHIHFGVFELANQYSNVKYYVGYDMSHSLLDTCTDKVKKNLTFVEGHQQLKTSWGEIETLESTDEGVAFIVKADKKVFLHAGDLAIWKERDGIWDFLKDIKPAKDIHIDYAMIPMDPRQGKSGEMTVLAYLSELDIDYFIPMHLWGQYDVIDKFVRKYPDLQERMVGITKDSEGNYTIKEGELYTIYFGQIPALPVLFNEDTLDILNRVLLGEKNHNKVNAIENKNDLIVTLEDILKRDFGLTTLDSKSLIKKFSFKMRGKVNTLFEAVDNKCIRTAKMDLKDLIKKVNNVKEGRLLMVSFYWYVLSKPNDFLGECDYGVDRISEDIGELITELNV